MHENNVRREAIIHQPPLNVTFPCLDTQYGVVEKVVTGIRLPPASANGVTQVAGHNVNGMPDKVQAMDKLGREYRVYFVEP